MMFSGSSDVSQGGGVRKETTWAVADGSFLYETSSSKFKLHTTVRKGIMVYTNAMCLCSKAEQILLRLLSVAAMHRHTH